MTLSGHSIPSMETVAFPATIIPSSTFSAKGAETERFCRQAILDLIFQPLPPFSPRPMTGCVCIFGVAGSPDASNHNVTTIEVSP